ncbi:MAG: glycosyltransferase family 4 protein [Bacillota bacterium]
MKIAIFTDTFTPQINGVTKSLERLIKYFERKNIEYMVFAPDSGKEPNYKDINQSLSFNFMLYPECKMAIPNYFKVKSDLKKFEPDLVHVVTQFNMGFVGLKAAKNLNIPVIASYHTNFTYYLDYYNLTILEKPLWSYFRWFHNQTRLNFCPSQVVKGELKNKGIRNLKIWSRGINAEIFNPGFRNNQVRKDFGAKNKLILLYVGRIAPEKNISLLLRSYKNLQKRHPGKTKLVITGDGPLCQEFKKENMKDVIFTGYLQGEGLSEVYASADIFTFPSVTETYGNVILEAMASGLPVVAIPEGGIKENLLDGHNGLASKNEVEDFTNNISDLIENPGLIKILGSNARDYALKKDWNKVFNKLILDYKDAINQSNLEEVAI